jgi:hypothetical protein
MVNSFHHQSIANWATASWPDSGGRRDRGGGSRGRRMGCRCAVAPESHAEAASPDLALFRGLVAASRRSAG